MEELKTNNQHNDLLEVDHITGHNQFICNEKDVNMSQNFGVTKIIQLIKSIGQFKLDCTLFLEEM